MICTKITGRYHISVQMKTLKKLSEKNIAPHFSNQGDKPVGTLTAIWQSLAQTEAAEDRVKDVFTGGDADDVIQGIEALAQVYGQ